MLQANKRLADLTGSDHRVGSVISASLPEANVHKNRSEKVCAVGRHWSTSQTVVWDEGGTRVDRLLSDSSTFDVQRSSERPTSRDLSSPRIPKSELRLATPCHQPFSTDHTPWDDL